MNGRNTQITNSSSKVGPWADRNREIVDGLRISPSLKAYIRGLIRTADKSLKLQGVELTTVATESVESRIEALNEAQSERIVDLESTIEIEETEEVPAIV